MFIFMVSMRFCSLIGFEMSATAPLALACSSVISAYPEKSTTGVLQTFLDSSSKKIPFPSAIRTSERIKSCSLRDRILRACSPELAVDTWNPAASKSSFWSSIKFGSSSTIRSLMGLTSASSRL